MGGAASARQDATASRSAPLAVELAKLLDASGLTSLAAKFTGDGNPYVAALYIPGSQLLVVTGRFAGPERMAHLIGQKEYREAYLDLSGASELATRMLFSDLGANGLHFGRGKNQPFDMVTTGGKGISFDRIVDDDERGSDDEYGKTFATMDQEYARLLETLIAVLKKPS
jgi:hypothetical protein